MKIILDCFGGDNCPGSAIDGALLAIAEDKTLNVTLCGDEKTIADYLIGKTYDNSRLSILNASDIITNDDTPTLAIRRKKDASMTVGLKTLAQEDYDGFVSSGNTGALLVGASLIVKRIDGVQRCSLSPVLPTMIDGKGTILVDSGANVDCSPEMLRDFALMGSAYMKSVCGIENPKVGLLNNGTEEEKGNSLTKLAYQMLKETDINFVGNIEPREIPFGEADIVVCDGFLGNTILKLSEGLSMALLGIIKEEITAGHYKIAAAAHKKPFGNIKKKLDADEIGGAPFLGLKSLVVKAHGSSNAKAIKNAIKQCMLFSEADIVSKIGEKI